MVNIASIWVKPTQWAGSQLPLLFPGNSAVHREMTWLQKMCVWLATGFGVGWAPVAPGTFGTALGVPLAWLIGHSCPLTLQIGVTMALLLIGVPICDVAARALNRKDPGNVIWDEIVTVPIVVMGLPPEQLDRPLVLLCAFALHRLFDISKLPPARQLEALPGGWGIMCDDVAAACYARGALQLIIVFLLR